MFRVTDQLAKAARVWPDHPAVTCAAGTLSWERLQARVHALASALKARGLRPGDRLAFLGFNGHMAVECYFAAPLIGAAVVPINFRLSDAELVETLHDCRPAMMVADADHAQMLARCMGDCPSIQLALAGGPAPEGMESYEATLENAPPAPDFEPTTTGGEDMLVMFYTGGTTGQPKGVMLSHTNIYSNAMGILANWDVQPLEPYAITGPMFHSASGARVYGAAMIGTHTILMPRFDIGILLKMIETHRVRIAQFVPTMIAMMLDHPDFGARDTSSLRMITYGAAPMPPELLARAMEAFPGVRFAQAFGMTEASPIATFLNPDEHDSSTPDGLRRLHSVGRPAPFVDLKILAQDGNEAPQGEVGEIALRGPNIMLGYWEKPELTADVLQNGWYRTGDAGYLDHEGYLHLAGRFKDMIITGGENVYPIEVERVLGSHPDVAEVAVIGAPDPKWGERVHAVIRHKPGTTPDADALIALCREKLAHYKCPKTIDFTDAPLPLTKVNKIDKLALRRALTDEAHDA